jgi:hypothetical protein
MFRLSHFPFVVLFVCLAALAAFGQIDADRRDPFSPRHNEDMPRNVVEKREQMRIDKEKKDHDEMLGRGEEAAKLAERLAASYAANGRLSDVDISNLEAVEKNVKKIRSELGGDADEEAPDEVLGKDKLNVADAVKSLKETTSSLLDELKKTSRFDISAAAIQSSNAAITIVRFIRFGK